MPFPGRFARFLLGVVLVTALWAGREFPAGPGESTASGQLLVRFRRATPAASVNAALPAGSRSRRLGPLDLYHVELPPGTAPGISRQLANHPLVEYVEPNRIRRTSVRQPNDPSLSSQWALVNTEAQKGWAYMPGAYLTAATAGTERVKVAVLDTGADAGHPDFKNAGGTSTDSAAGGQLSFSLSRAFVNTTVAPPIPKWLDDHGHGTHVAGTVAAATNNLTGVSALGYPIELVIYKVMEANGSGTDANISEAIMTAADAGARVISLSLGAVGYSQSMQDAVNYAWERNALVVAAAGNNSANELFFPAGANYAIGVAATDSSNNRAFFSNYGDIVDIAAPGESILSLVPTYGSAYFVSNYHTLSGTSMATPHVSALAGLLAGSTANLSVAAIAQRLQQAAGSTIAMGGWDPTLGYGVLNAWRALSGTLRQASLGGIVGQVIDGAGLPIENAVVTAGGQSVTTSTSGLFRFSNLTAGTYSVSATAAGFTARTLTATAVAGADVTLAIPMSGTFGTLSGTVSGAGGPLAGAAVEALSGGVIKGAAPTGADGQYSLSVPPGTYDVRASRMSRITSTVSGQAVVANTTTTVNLTLVRMGSITGTVRDLSNNPLANAQVTAAGAGFSGGGLTDATGNYTTIGLPAGTYTVTVSGSGVQDQTVSGVAVSNDADTLLNFQVDVWTISAVSPATATLRANQTQQFTASVYPSNQTVIWSLSPTAGAISSNGLYTAPADIPAFQTVIVKATHSADSTVSSSSTVTLAPTLTLTVTPASVVGGVATTGNRVTLDSPAPAGGAVVALASSNSSVAAVPATVGVAAGETTANFTITTAAVAAATTVNISATYSGVTRTAPLTLNPVTLNNLVLSPATVAGGSSTTGNRVELNGPAPPSGAAVSLTSSNPSAAQVPATVTVAAAASLAYFTITTSAVTVSTPVTISATYGGATSTRTLTVVPLALSFLTVSPGSVYGGQSATLSRVTLNGAAPGGGVVVSLASSNPAVASLPASVTVAEGSTQAGFTITTTHVAASTAVTISASYAGVTKTGTLTVQPVVLSLLSLGTNSGIGGRLIGNNKPYLTAGAPPEGAVVTLASSNPAVASVPPSVTIAAGQTNAAFSITTTTVTTATPVTISASWQGVTKTAVLTVEPWAVTGLAISPTLVGGGGTTTNNRVSLNGSAPAGGLVVSLASSSPAVASVPATVAVPAGSPSVKFNITTTHVAVLTAVTITATLGESGKSGTLTVEPLKLTSLALSPTSVGGGGTTTANTVTLNAPAPAGGAAVSLSSSNAAVASVPAAVTVPAGASSATFSITTTTVASATAVTISASLGGVTQSGTLTVEPTVVSALSLSPTSVIGGAANATGTVTLNGPGPATVALSSSNPTAASVPATVTVAAAATSATFTVTTTLVGAATAVTLSASYGGLTKTAALTVNPVAVSNLTLSPTITGGGAVTTQNRVSLNAPAPPGGAGVTLTSSQPGAASVAATVTIAAGASSVLFTITTYVVAASTPVTISASYGGSTRTAILTVDPLVVSSLTISPGAFESGESSSQNKVTLNGPAPSGGAAVSLTSSNPAVASVPATVTVPAGTTQATFTTTGVGWVTSPTPVTISASYGGVTRTGTLTIYPAVLTSLSFFSTSVIGGGPTNNNKPMLNGPAPPGGAVVTLSSSNPAVAWAPPSVTIPAGAYYTTFTINTAVVTTSTVVIFSATYNGVTKTNSLTVNPIVLSSLALSPTSVKGGTPTTSNKVTLNAAAPAGGAVVNVSSSNPAVASPPATVTVPAGATQATFTIATTAVAASTSVTITATYGGVTQTATLTVNP